MNPVDAVRVATMKAEAHKRDFAVVSVNGEIDVRTYKNAVAKGYEILEVVRCSQK